MKLSILRTTLAVIIFFVCLWLLFGCTENEVKLKCNPDGPVRQLYHAKCYMEGQLIFDADVVCPTFWRGGILWNFYDEKTRSVVTPDSDLTQCFVLKVKASE